jgi:hypothetical protein
LSTFFTPISYGFTVNTKTAISTLVFGVMAATSVAHASDLAAWRSSGLEQAHAGELTPDTFSETYRAKLAIYRQLTESQDAQASIAQTSRPPLTRAEVVADLAAWRVAGLGQAYAGELTPDTSSTVYRAKHARYQQLIVANNAQTSTQQETKPPLTRVEVVADLAAWRAAGLGEAHAGELTPDTSNVAYRAKRERYQQLIAQG